LGGGERGGKGKKKARAEQREVEDAVAAERGGGEASSDRGRDVIAAEGANVIVTETQTAVEASADDREQGQQSQRGETQESQHTVRATSSRVATQRASSRPKPTVMDLQEEIDQLRNHIPHLIGLGIKAAIPRPAPLPRVLTHLAERLRIEEHGLDPLTDRDDVEENPDGSITMRHDRAEVEGQ